MKYSFTLISFLCVLCVLCGEKCVAGEPAAKEPSRFFEVKKIENVSYHNGPDADRVRHKLDLYLPVGKQDFPVIFYVHGGAWQIGHKNQLGMPAKLGHSFAKRGIAFVSINYRLSPTVKHPGHITDVARAFAWTHANIAKYGGKPDEIFACGHSAGGHLVALLATNPRYLKEQGLTPNAVRGVIPISGVFEIPNERLFVSVFGKEPASQHDASPIKNADRHAPPFLILYAESDFPHCGRPWAQSFCKVLQDKGACAQIREFPKRSHVTILWNATRDDDPANQMIFDFIVSHVVLHRLAASGMGGVEVLGEFLGR